MTEADFSLVEVKGRDGEVVRRAVMLTSTQGIDLGDPDKVIDPARSYDAIMSDPNDERFQVEVGGKTVDTRTLTLPDYTAFIYHAHRAAIDRQIITNEEPSPSPDSSSLYLWTCTLLLGEEPIDILARVARASEIHWVEARTVLRDSGDRAVRFRPAVVIE